MPTPHESYVLKIPHGVPVTYIERTHYSYSLPVETDSDPGSREPTRTRPPGPRQRRPVTSRVLASPAIASSQPDQQLNFTTELTAGCQEGALCPTFFIQR